MADEIVTIKIKVNADTREIKRVNRELAQVGVQAKLVDKSTSDLSRAFSNRLDPSLRKTKNRLNSLGSALATFNKLALKVFAVTFVVAAASLASVNALFATGRFLVQAYRVTMQALAVGVTAVGAALSVVAAAQREYNAALYAYSYKASPQLGKGINSSRAALRMLQTDSNLAVFGMEALNSSFATLSKSGQVTGKTVGALRAFADFAAAGGDPGKNLQGIAEVLAVIEKKGKLTGDAIAMAGNVNDAFALALNRANKAGKTSYADLIDFIEKSGIKAELGIEGQSELLGNTLVGKFKRFTTQIVAMFADIGQPLLGPVSVAFEKMFRIIRNGVVRLAPEFIRFGSGRMLDGLVSATQKLTDALVNLTRKYLDGSVGMLKKFTDWWGKVEVWFNRTVDAMRPLLDGGSEVIRIFGPVLGEVFGKIGDVIQELDKYITGNTEEWADFGRVIQDTIRVLGEMLQLFFRVFNAALPILNPIIEALNAVARGIMGVAAALSNLGSIGGLLSMFGLLFAGKGIKNFARYSFGRGQGTGGGLSSIAQGMGDAGNNMAYIATSGRTGTPGKGFFSQYATARSMGDVSRMQSARLAAEYSGIGGRVAGFGKSFGPGLGLGLLAPLVGREAQGGVLTGSMIAGLAPLLGAAGPAAALLGTGVAGMSIAKNATTAGGGALGGAMTGLAGGAAAGAAIGMVGGPIGAVGGAIIGTAAGAIIGAIQGRARGEKKKVASAVEKSTGELYNTVANAMGRGDTRAARSAIKEAQKGAERLMGIYEEYFKGVNDRGARKDIAGQLLSQGKISETEAKNFALAPGTYAKGIRDAADKTEQYLNGPLDRYDKVVGILEKSTGKSADEIKNLADTIGINLYDDSIQLTSVLRDMGSAMAMTGEQIKQAMYDMAVQSFSIFDTEIQKIEAPKILSEQVSAMQKLLSSGSAQTEDIIKFVKDWGEQLLLMNPDKPLAVIQELFDQFYGLEGNAFAAGGAFETFGPQFQEALKGVFSQLLKDLPGYRKTLVEDIANNFLGRGMSVDAGQLMGALSRMDYQELEGITTALETGSIYGGPKVSTEEALNRLLTNEGYTGPRIGVSKLEEEPLRNFEDMSAEESAIRAQFMSTMESFFADQPPEWMKSNPPWWGPLPGDDTSTPRGDTTSARLGKTLSRHKMLNGQIAGKRTITSAYRTSGLGSINSDHVTGKAYDLIGQNLGAYSQLVKKSGGFAEFHGLGGDRHLHVVPGSGPMGDTSMPSMVSSSPLPSSSTTNNYSIVVNGGNDSAEQIARKVMDEIARGQRSARERR